MRWLHAHNAKVQKSVQKSHVHQDQQQTKALRCQNHTEYMISICQLTSYMHLGTVSRPSRCMAWQTTILHNWWVKKFGYLMVLNGLKGELEHCHVKCFYARTNKINFAHAIAKHQQRERLLHQMTQEHHSMGKANPQVDEVPPDCPPEAHYQIGDSTKYYWNLGSWLVQHKDN